MKYNLPRGRLSYSEVSQWLKNKDQYRERYYMGKKGPMTPEMYFGFQIAKKMEENDPSVDFIPRFKIPEHFIEVELDGVKVGGHLDSFCPDTFSFRDTKTSRTNYWSNLTVAKHMQLDFYSLLVEKKYGKVNPKCYLDWAETAFKTKTIMFAGHELKGDSQELYLTGNVVTFERKIAKWEREKMAELILMAAKEITEDFTRFQKERPHLVVDMKHLDR